MNSKYYPIAEKIIELHKEGNGVYNWYEIGNSTMIRFFPDLRSLGNIDYYSIRRRLIQMGLITSCATKGLPDNMCLTDKGWAFQGFEKDADEPKTYNLLFETKGGGYNIFKFPKEKLPIIIEAYEHGMPNFTISGQKYVINGLHTFRIFENSKEDLEVPKFEFSCKELGLVKRNLRDFYCSAEGLATLGKEVTEAYIGDHEYGYKANHTNNLHNTGHFVHPDRILELENINDKQFDLTRLIKLCREINDNYRFKNYLSVGMIGRTILNHVPPIFGFKTFEEVVNNYNGGQSFRKSMDFLYQQLKNIADSYLHQTIRKNDPPPNETQISLHPVLDILLAEIVRILKDKN